MGCQDNRTTALEKRVADLELRVKLAEEKQAANAEAATQQEVAFKNCLTQANEDFLAAVMRLSNQLLSSYTRLVWPMPKFM